MYNNRMSNLAIDIALLPPDDIMNRCIEINQTFPKYSDADEYIQHKETCVPHVTLAMGLVDEEKLPEIIKELEEIKKDFSPLELTTHDIKTSTLSNDKQVSEFLIQKTSKLQNLHNAVMDMISAFFSDDSVTKEMFFPPPPLDEGTPRWVKNFVRTSSREKYRPHITLGLGIPKNVKVPINFTASTLALCHLGNYCTCRKILFSTEIQ
jgi:hypothetical protein